MAKAKHANEHILSGNSIVNNQLKDELLLFTLGLGFGYSVERTKQGASLASFTPRREPAWEQDLDPDDQDLLNRVHSEYPD